MADRSPSFPEICTERLILRNLQPADDAAVFAMFSNDLVTEFYDQATYTDIAQAQAVVAGFMRMNEMGGERGMRWAIALAGAPAELIGTCGYHSTNKRFSSFEIGYDLMPAHWGKGYAFEAMHAVIAHCFTQNFPFPVNRISATTNLDSTRSIRLLHRLGFMQEGVLRQYGYWKNAFHDVRIFSLLRSGWIS